MMLFMGILCGVAFVVLVLTAGMKPQRARMSGYELERRRASGDAEAKSLLRREGLLPDIISLQRIVSALMLVIFAALSVAAFGWLLGVVLALVVALEYGAVAKWPWIQRRARKLYDHYESALLDCVERFPGVMRFIRNVGNEKPVETRLDSREELVHLVEKSGTILSGDEKRLIVHSLGSHEREVREIMTPRGVIDSIDQKELLGPLVLDDLHKTGHSRFPVISGDVDHVVGMLHVQNLLTLDSKRSVTAGKAMEPRVFYIREDQNLQHALAAFIRTHHHLFVVVNEFRETVGLLSLEDVIEALLGRKIVDEFDAHDDLRAVAKRNPRKNNHPEKHENV